MHSSLCLLISAALLIHSTHAVPALVWHSKQQNSRALSETVGPADILAVRDEASSEQPSVVFVLERDEKASEDRLSELASAGSLPEMQAAFSAAGGFDSYHAVSGVRSAQSVARDIRQSNADKKTKKKKVMEISMKEYQQLQQQPVLMVETDVTDSGMLSKTAFKMQKRAKDMRKADYLVVNVDKSVSPEQMDQTIAASTKHTHSVMVTAVRTIQEIRHEREMIERHLFQQQRAAGRRYLEQTQHKNSQRRRLDENQGDNNGNDNNKNNDQDLTRVYYVSMTPNIMAGLLFMLLFITTAYVGLTCMNAISGGDTYVKSPPPVGKEA